MSEATSGHGGSRRKSRISPLMRGPSGPRLLQRTSFRSFPRKRESSAACSLFVIRIPAFAGTNGSVWMQVSHARAESDAAVRLAAGLPLPRLHRLVNSRAGSSGEVAVRYFAMVLVALLTAAGGALADTPDPAVAAMFREWSLSAPTPSRVVICHGFGCAFHTEIALPGGERAPMAATMPSRSPPALPPAPPTHRPHSPSHSA